MAAVSHNKSNTIPDFTGTVTGYNSQGSTTTIAATDLVRPSDWNSVHNFFVTASGNTAISSTASGTNLVYGFTNGVTGSLSTNASVATLWVGGGILKGWNNNVPLVSTNTVSSVGNVSYMQPLYLPCPVSADFVRFPVLFTTTGTGTAATTANTAFSASQFFTFNVGVYTEGTGASSESLFSYASGQAFISNQRSFSAGANGSQYTITNRYTLNVSNTTTSFSTTIGRSTSNVSVGTGLGVESVSGPKLLDIPLGALLPASNYWLGFGSSSSSSTQGNSVLIESRVHPRQYMAAQDNQNFGYLGSTTNTAAKYESGLGSYTATTILSEFNSTIISSMASNVRFPVTLGVL